MQPFGETAVDAYMGLAQLALLAISILPLLILFCGKTNVLMSGMVLTPLLVNIILWAWRDRLSGSAFGFSVMQSIVMAVLLQTGSIRKDVLREVASKNGISRVANSPRLHDFLEKASSLWIAALVGAVLIIVGGGSMILAIVLAPDSTFSWAIHPKERQLLEILFVIATACIFSEAVLLVWFRTRSLKTLKGLLFSQQISLSKL